MPLYVNIRGKIALPPDHPVTMEVIAICHQGDHAHRSAMNTLREFRCHYTLHGLKRKEEEEYIDMLQAMPIVLKDQLVTTSSTYSLFFATSLAGDHGFSTDISLALPFSKFSFAQLTWFACTRLFALVAATELVKFYNQKIFAKNLAFNQKFNYHAIWYCIWCHLLAFSWFEFLGYTCMPRMQAIACC